MAVFDIYIYPVALRAAPATAPGMGPKTTKTTKNRYHKLSKNQIKLRPGGVPEGLGGGLGTILTPKSVPGTPGDEKVPKIDFATPPPGTQLEVKFGFFVDFVGFFSYCFFECRFGRPPGGLLSGFGEVF